MSAYGEAVLDGEAEKIRLARKGNRNNTVYLAALRCGRVIDGCNLDEDEVADILYDAAIVSYTTSSASPEPGFEEAVRATIRSGMAKGRNDPRRLAEDITSREEAVEEVLEVLEGFMATPMGGHVANRMYPVMLAICGLGLIQGGPSAIRAPVRKVRIIAGLSGLGTTSKAVKDLIEHGFLTVYEKGDSMRGTTYNVRLPVRDENTPTHPPGMQMRSHLAHNSHDAFHRSALGRAGQRILAFLEAEPGKWFTQTDLAKEMGISPSTVNRHVQPHRGLVRHGLVERDRLGRVRVTRHTDKDDLDEVAFAMKTIGRGDHRRRQTARRYQEQGLLTEDFHWIDQTTGEVTSAVADWLLPTVHVPGGRAKRPAAPAPIESGAAAAADDPVTNSTTATPPPHHSTQAEKAAS